MRIAALAGGVGASKLLLGLYRVMDPADLTAIVNTGDDIVMHGLHVSPDPDIVTYTLADAVNPDTGWGMRDESFRVADGLARYGRETWFKLGDRDLATHIHRSAMLAAGGTLSEAMESIGTAHGVMARLLPMSDQPMPTTLLTNEGPLHLQEYLVKRRAEPVLTGILFEGAERAKPAPGVIEALDAADGIVICPSNPLISIGPILAVPGIREALRKHRHKVAAVCPLVGGKSLKGPSDKMMDELGYDVSAIGVAEMYRDICSIFVIDDADEAGAPAIAAMDMKPVIRSTIMRTVEDKENLARAVLKLFA